MIALHLATTNDTNGNPRRLFLMVQEDDDGRDVTWVDAIDEGYHGSRGYQTKYPRAIYGGRIEVKPSEYASILKGYAAPTHAAK